VKLSLRSAASLRQTKTDAGAQPSDSQLDSPHHPLSIVPTIVEAREQGLTVEWLPKYAPELSDIEVVWHDLKAHHLAHHTFADADALERAIHAAVAALNQERTINPLVNQRISA
jgi:DDE superfamily endonuclease